MTKRVVIIGGGPGGYPTAFLLAQRGVKVTLIEKDKLGGTCLNRGCIPTKVLLRTANLLREIGVGQKIGAAARGVHLDFDQLRRHKDEVVDSFVSGVERLCERRKISVVRGTGFFETPRQIRIRETGELVEGDATIIATGSVPAQPPIKGAEGGMVLNSDQALSLERIPPSIVIIGGGYIGLEFAQILRSFGSEVTVLELLNRVLPQEDAEISAALNRALTEEGITIHTGVAVKEIVGGNERKVVRYAIQKQAHSVEAVTVLVAVGRRCNTDEVGLERVGVKTENGRILVNQKMETTVPGIYAVGDAVGGSMLAHVATAEGRIAADNILADSEQAIDYTSVPRCIHTYPEVASVGLTETEAKEVHGEILVGRLPFQAMAKARILGGLGFAKMICEKKYGRIVGVDLIGAGVSELIYEAMSLECTAEEMAYTMHPHPTLSELLMESAMAIQGYKIHSV
jgi:dihydrolipoamide dehydrogenase